MSSNPGTHTGDQGPPARSLRRVTLLGGVIGAVLLILALRDIDWARALQTLRRAEAGPLLVAFGLLSASYAVRGWRWRALLSHSLPLSPSDAFWAMALGYLGNAILPARGGDLLRAEVVYRRAPAADRAFVLATVVVERIVEICALVGVSAWALAAIPAVPGWLAAATRAMSVVAGLGAGSLLLARWAEPLALAALGRLPLAPANRTRLGTIVGQAVRGALVLHRPRTALSFAGMTALIWGLEIGYTIAIARALHLDLTAAQATLLLAALGVASALPSTPGYVGIYQFVAVTVLPLFGAVAADALVYILCFQLVQYASVLVWGALGASRLGVQWRGRARQGRTPHTSASQIHE